MKDKIRKREGEGEKKRQRDGEKAREREIDREREKGGCEGSWGSDRRREQELQQAYKPSNPTPNDVLLQQGSLY